MTARFGPAGNSERFSQKFKSSKDAPKWLDEMGLTAYEYQCGRGVNVGEVTARAIGDEAWKYGIAMSVHAPYFINISSDEPERIEKNIKYILDAARCADFLRATRVVVHMGGISKNSRGKAMENSIENISQALKNLDGEGLGHITLCIETMGKINTMGTLDDVLAMCRMDERLLPCIDFGHLNARNGGKLKTYEDFKAIFDTMETQIGFERASKFHSHFSKIEFSKGGEVRHLTFADTKYGPVFDHVARLTAERDYAPTFICESAGTQDEDALAMKLLYEECVEKR